jgi:hypothetical protein
MFCCPEGAEEFSPGFQPWEPSSHPIRPEGAGDHRTLTGAINAVELEPFQGYSEGRYGSRGLNLELSSSAPSGQQNCSNFAPL